MAAGLGPVDSHPGRRDDLTQYVGTPWLSRHRGRSPGVPVPSNRPQGVASGEAFSGSLDRVGFLGDYGDAVRLVAEGSAPTGTRLARLSLSASGIEHPGLKFLGLLPIHAGPGPKLGLRDRSRWREDHPIRIELRIISHIPERSVARPTSSTQADGLVHKETLDLLGAHQLQEDLPPGAGPTAVLEGRRAGRPGQDRHHVQVQPCGRVLAPLDLVCQALRAFGGLRLPGLDRCPQPRCSKVAAFTTPWTRRPRRWSVPTPCGC